MTPIAAFFQPVRNHKTLSDLGVTHLFGPEIEGGSSVTRDQWARSASDLGMKVVLKGQQPGIPLNCVGFLHQVDEPNGKGVTAAMLKPEFDRLRALMPTMPIFLSLAGDKVVYDAFPSPADKQLYLDYATVCDVFMVDFYSMNRNASRYSTGQTAKAVKNLIALTGKPVWSWIEVNDQQLSKPNTPDVNRAPTPDEIEETVTQCLTNGSAGIGWFATCANGAYHWPDSYWPSVDRHSLSMQPQYARLKDIANRLNQPSLESRVAAIESWQKKNFTF